MEVVIEHVGPDRRCLLHHGIEGVEAATRDQFEIWDWFWQEGEKFIEAGDDVVVLTRLTAG